MRQRPHRQDSEAELNTYRHKVQYYETDKMGITHHSNYIRFMEEARVDFLSQIGWDYERLEEIGIVSPVTAVDCRFRSPTAFADVIETEVWIEEFKGARLKIGYLMKKSDGTVVCEAHSEHCFINADGHPIRLKKEHPEFAEVLERLANNK